MDSSERKRLATTQALPRPLFRAVSDQSRGGPAGNNASVIDPLADHREGYRPRFSDMDYDSAEIMLDTHYYYDYTNPSAFSSWSTSLLWVLVHAIRKTFHKGEANALIYVLDTAALDPERVFHAGKLLRMFDSVTKPDHAEEYAVGEYLIYGKLEQRDGFTAVPLKTLIEAGLYRTGGCAPMLDIQRQRKPKDNDGDLPSDEKLERLHQRVHQCRHAYFHTQKAVKNSPRKSIPVECRIMSAHIDKMFPAEPPRHKQIDADGKERWDLPVEFFAVMRELRKCFGPAWEATMTVAFASLRRRDVMSKDIAVFLAELGGLPLLSLGAEYTEDNGHELLEERAQLIEMLHMLEERAARV